MRLKILKNSALALLATLILALPLAGMPAPAHAEVALDPQKTVDCLSRFSGGSDNKGITVRIVACSKDALFKASKTVGNAVGGFISPIIPVLATIAVIVIGIMSMTGQAPAWKETVTILAKIVFVYAVATSVGSNLTQITQTIDELIGAVTIFNEGTMKNVLNAKCEIPSQNPFQGSDIVTSEISPVWYGIDCALNTLIGSSGTSFSISDGIIGFLITSLFSGAIGILVGVLGIFMVFVMLFVLAQALFVYITSIAAICLLVIVSPIFIPMIIFNSTKNYFSSWLSVLFNYILQPVVLFAYLSMMMIGMGHVMFTGENSIYRVVSNNTVRLTDEGSPSFGSYVSPSIATTSFTPAALVLNAQNVNASGKADQGLAGSISQGSASACPATGCVQTPTNFDRKTALDARSFFGVEQPMKTLNWDSLKQGSDTTEKFQIKVLVSFLSAAMTAYIFLSLLKQMPYIGSAVSGGGLPVFGTGSLSGTHSNTMDSLKSMFSSFSK